MLDLYGSDGNIKSSITMDPLGEFSGTVMSLPAEVADGRYAGVVSSDGPVGVVVHNTNTTAKATDFYAGFGAGDVAQKLVFPLAFRNWFSQVGTARLWSTFHIQNVSGSAQTAKVTYTTAKGWPFSGQTVVSTTASIPPNTSVDVLMSDSAFAGVNVTFGSATVEGTSGNIAVVVDHIQQDTGNVAANQFEQLTAGIPESVAASQVVFPLAFNKYVGYLSGVNVMNLGPQTTVTAKFVDARNGATTKTMSQVVGTNEVYNFYLPSFMPSNWYGACTLTTSNGSDKIIGVISTVVLTNGRWGSSGANGLMQSTATTKLVAPLVYIGRYMGGNWVGSVQIYNMDTSGSATIHVKLVKSPGSSGPATFNLPDQTAGVGQSVNWYMPNYAATLGAGWFGTAYVSSNKAIMGVNNSDNLANGLSGAYPCPNYTAP